MAEEASSPSAPSQWPEMIACIDEGIAAVAARFAVPVEILRQNYVLSTLFVGAPLVDTAGYTVSAGATPGYSRRKNKDEFAPKKGRGGGRKTEATRVLEPSQQQRKHKFFCDIEAAITGCLSEEGERGDGDWQPPTDHPHPTYNPSTVDAVGRYPQQDPLEVNVLHKAFITHVEESVLYVRLLGRKPPPIGAHVGSASSPNNEQLIIGTPCLVLANLKANECETRHWYRCAVETVCDGGIEVRLVDYGILLRGVHPSRLRLLPRECDGAAIAYRLAFDSLPAPQSSALRRYSFVSLRVASSYQRSLTWCKTWRVVTVQQHSVACLPGPAPSSPAPSRMDPIAAAGVSGWLNGAHREAGGNGIRFAIHGEDQVPAALASTQDGTVKTAL